jgi:hypothetical protein
MSPHITDSDLGHLLREGIDQATDGIRLPPGLAGRARRQHARRRRAVRAAGLAGAATTAGAVAAAAVLTTSAPAVTAKPAVRHAAGRAAAGQAAGGQQARTVAEIVRRTGQAVGSDLVLESTGNMQLDSLQYSRGHRTWLQLRYLSWSYRNLSAIEGFTGPAGFAGPRQVRFAMAGRATSSTPKSVSAGTYTRVDYVSRTWGRATVRERVPAAPVPLNCSQRQYLSRPMAVLRTDLSTSPASIRAAVACGGLRITGRGRVNGQSVIKLAGTTRLTRYPLAVDVSPATYLPVRLTFGQLRFDYRWLKPGSASLAPFTLQPPAGFRRVAYNRT